MVLKDRNDWTGSDAWKLIGKTLLGKENDKKRMSLLEGNVCAVCLLLED